MKKIMAILFSALFLLVLTACDPTEEAVDYKPVIYLYSQETMEVSVKLKLDGEITCTYPKYGQGWNVIADPDGTLTDSQGKKYNYLYW